MKKYEYVSVHIGKLVGATSEEHRPDKWVSASFGRTHLIETGNLSGIPLLVFHGGNATTAYNLFFCDFLMNDFHIYAVDTIGHPGKSDEVSLSAWSYDYGKWASEVISAIGYESISCFGGSANMLHKAIKNSQMKIIEGYYHGEMSMTMQKNM